MLDSYDCGLLVDELLHTWSISSFLVYPFLRFFVFSSFRFLVALMTRLFVDSLIRLIGLTPRRHLILLFCFLLNP